MGHNDGNVMFNLKDLGRVLPIAVVLVKPLSRRNMGFSKAPHRTSALRAVIDAKVVRGFSLPKPKWTFFNTVAMLKTSENHPFVSMWCNFCSKFDPKKHHPAEADLNAPSWHATQFCPRVRGIGVFLDSPSKMSFWGHQKRWESHGKKVDKP